MSVVIDASVWVASARLREPGYEASRQFLQRVRDSAVDVLCPSLVFPECTAAIARPTGNALLADALTDSVEAFPRLNLVPLALNLTRRAAANARDCRLRGANSIYVAVADHAGAPLITWDAEVIDRCRDFIHVMTPDEWLRAL